MKKLKNKFIISIIFLIISILSIQFYMTSSMKLVDNNSYLSLVKGKGLLNDNILQNNEKYTLNTNDSIRTIGESSLILIEWGDGSITRLGGNTNIIIGENDIAKGKTKINISFDLLSGKTWSNVISLIGKDSSFKQSFSGIEAGVRGTTFNVDLSKNYVNVTSHEVTLTDKEGNDYIIGEDKPFSLSNLSFIEIKDFLKSFQDKTWEESNITFDTEYIKGLKVGLDKRLHENNPFLLILEIFSVKYRVLYELENDKDYGKIEKLISTLDSNEIDWLYNKIFSYYQELNFINSDSMELLEIKILYKKVLLLLTTDEESKRILVKSSLYDLKDIMGTNAETFTDLFQIIDNNKDILNTIELKSFNEYKESISSSLNIIKDGLKNVDSNIKEKVWTELDNMYNLFDK